MKKVVFEKTAFVDFTEWVEIDRKIYKRIVAIIIDILRNPFSGLGKPEQLKYELNGYWSRRINQEHRLVYKIEDDFIIIVSCKLHYN